MHDDRFDALAYAFGNTARASAQLGASFDHAAAAIGNLAAAMGVNETQARQDIETLIIGGVDPKIAIEAAMKIGPMFLHDPIEHRAHVSDQEVVQATSRYVEIPE